MPNPAENRPVSVVVPVFNERGTIEAILARVAGSDLVGEIVVVDDASTDGTREILAAARPVTGVVQLKVLLQRRNRGKGAAVRRGFEAVTRPVTIVQDADLEYDPADYELLVRPILQGQADVVFGSRFLGRGLGGRWFHTLGNRALTLWSNLFTGLHVTDVHTCYKALDSRLLSRVRLRRNRFDFDPELAVRLGRLNLRVREVPIRYSPRRWVEGKKIGWRDGFEALATTLRCAVL